MNVDWAQIIELLVLFVLILISNRWSQPLGGLLHMMISLTLTIPYLGKIFKFLLQSPINLNALTKPISWLVSSSGLLIGLGIHNLFWGVPNQLVEFWVIFFVALIGVFGIVEDMISFDNSYSYINEIYPELKKAPYKIVQKQAQMLAHYGDETIFRRLARSLFVDQTLPQLFRLLINIGVIYFCLGNLGILEIIGSEPPNLWESLILSFSLIDISGELTAPFTGSLWNFIRIVSSFIAFFWLVLFVSLSSASVDEAVDDVEKSNRRDFELEIRRIADEVLSKSKTSETTEKTRNHKTHEEPRKGVMISRALINPTGQDAGNEAIFIVNTTETNIIVRNWNLENKNNSRYEIPDLEIKAGEEAKITLPAYSLQLANSGGLIRLIDANESEIDQVSYDKSQIDSDGIVNWL